MRILSAIIILLVLFFHFITTIKHEIAYRDCVLNLIQIIQYTPLYCILSIRIFAHDGKTYRVS